MIDLSYNLVGAFGQLNKACNEANVKYIIKKYPREDYYSGYIGQSPVIASDYCDELFEKMIEQANSYSN